MADRPKPMAEIEGEPFLNILIDYAAGFGFRRFILGIGHKKDFIKNYYRENKTNLDILFSEEDEPLGTAGAVKNAESIIKSEPFIVMNGDSFCKIDFNRFIDFYFEREASVCIAASSMEGGGEFGEMVLDHEERIVSFNEKEEPKRLPRHLINTGIYIMDRAIFGDIPEEKNISMEKEIFPNILQRGVYGFCISKEFIDIGTPERLKKARDIKNTKGNL
ncbi:MAG: hypothetical protein HQ593_03215 [Candidatus Omnitrophica bacterium]|nr:hypothetical protein [Candidatus Omnitrophota bacterium]